MIDIETTARLPAGGEAAARSLMLALAQPVEEHRASRAVDLSSLARLFVHMSSLRDPLAIADLAVRSLGRVLPVETSQLLLLDESGELVESAEWRAAGRGLEPLPLPALQALREHIDAAAVFELLDPAAAQMPELAGLRLRSVVLIPLRANGAEVGLLVGASRFVKEFDREQGELASLLAAHAAASLDAAIALDRERRSAHTDPLTGLLNRRGLEELLDRELGDAHEEPAAAEPRGPRLRRFQGRERSRRPRVRRRAAARGRPRARARLPRGWLGRAHRRRRVRRDAAGGGRGCRARDDREASPRAAVRASTTPAFRSG